MVAVLAVSGWIVACGPSPAAREAIATAVGTPSGEERSATIGAEGGTLASADGVLTIVVPPGALASSVALSVVAISNEAPGGLGAGYRISPEGLTLTEPAELTFTWTDAELIGSHPDALGIGFQNADRYWVPLVGETTRDDAAHTIRARTTHFSDWTRLVGYQLQPGSASVRTGESLDVSLTWCAPIDVDAELVALSGCAPIAADEGISAEGWAVNGVDGGGGAFGRVERVGEGAARYVAPASVPDPPLVAVSAQVGGALGRVLVVSNVRVEGGGDRYVGTLLATREFVDAASPENGFFTTVRADIDAPYDPGLDSYRFSGTAIITSYAAVSDGLRCTASDVEVLLEGFLYVRPGGTYGFSFGGEVDADASCDDPAMTVLPYTLEPLAAAGCGSADDVPLHYDDASLLAGSYDYECDLTSLLDRRQATWSFERR